MQEQRLLSTGKYKAISTIGAKAEGSISPCRMYALAGRIKRMMQQKGLPADTISTAHIQLMNCADGSFRNKAYNTMYKYLGMKKSEIEKLLNEYL